MTAEITEQDATAASSGTSQSETTTPWSDLRSGQRVTMRSAIAGFSMAVARSLVEGTFNATTTPPSGSVTGTATTELAHRDYKSVLSEEIGEYANLPDGWDGPRSVAPSATAIRNALAFLDSMPPNIRAIRPMISADGEVGFYQRRADSYFDIGFLKDGQMEYYARARGKEYHGAALYKRKELPSGLLIALVTA